MNIAVAGGGLFGVVAAIVLQQSGHKVHLFERRSTLISAASGINHGRLHRGYHYPRSPETARQCELAYTQFATWFGDSIRPDDTYVAISRIQSKVTSSRYESTLDQYRLPYTLTCAEPYYDTANVAAAYKIPEYTIDLDHLRHTCLRLLQLTGVKLDLGTKFEARMESKFDASIIATYADLPHLVSGYLLPRLRFDTTLKVLLTPESVKNPNTSRLVLDGPFANMSPYSYHGTQYVMLGDTLHGMVARTIGLGSFDARAESIRCFIRHAGQFLTGLDDAEVANCVYVTRVTLDGVQESDARPTIVRRAGPKRWIILGGKLVTCVLAAHELRSELKVG